MKNIVLLYLMMSVMTITVGAQEKTAVAKSTVKVEVVDENAQAIPFARVSSAKNRNVYFTDENGLLEFDIPSNDVIKISAHGYGTVVIPADKAGGKITLEREKDFDGEDGKLYTLFGQTTERRTVGAYSKINGDDLEATPTMFFLNALGGRLNGLFTMDNTLVPGFTDATSFVRTSQGGMTVMVDGVERSLDYIEPETVESVQLLKDASLKSLYGGIQTNGILMIKTRRGKEFENGARINVQTGIQQPTGLPKYLNSYDYAAMYNQASINNGMAPYFEPEKYRTGNPLLYPDVDYYDMFLNDYMTITRANVQYSGGTKTTRFFTHVGYQTNGGLEAFTEYPNRDKVYTIRGNVDNLLLDFITFSAGFNAALQNKSWPNMSTQTFFNMLSDTRPNEFPILIPGSVVGIPEKEYVFGGTAVNRNNPYGALVSGGNAEREYSFIQSDFALDIDLDKWVKGLSIKPVLTFDVYNYFTSTQGATYPVYEMLPPLNEGDPLRYNAWGEETRATSMTRSGATTTRNYVFNVTGNYNRKFGKHDVNALITYFQQVEEHNALVEYLKRLNFGGLVNYMYDNRYAVEASLNRVGVGSFAPAKQFGVFPTFGAGWIISEESFLRSVKALDYWKIRGSYGVLGSTSYTADGLFSAYLYRDVWEPQGTYGVSGFNNIARQTQTGNPNIGFQKSYELNIGTDIRLFNRSLTLSAGYFNNRLDGALANLNDITPGITGKNAALMQQNYKQYKSVGWEAEALYAKNFGGLNIALGANFTAGKTDITKEANPNYPAEYAGLLKISTVGDILGQRYTGAYTDENDIETSARQAFGAVTTGDFKYADTNGDGSVDNKDRVVIANTTPSYEYGITLKLEYKGFNLDLMGYGLGGFDRVLDGKYYRIYGSRKYSQVLIDGLPNGYPHPTVSPEYRNNNFITSDYWVADGSYFKLRNVELGYTLPFRLTQKVGMGKVKVFARGFNLLTISDFKDLDPENLDAGIGNFPLCMTLTGGLSVSF
ncbi:MAG: SusC/RagA family TonB-linked outer membrane protein [Tannerella sp.]|nr:SusC/RagA family TonB-linked outer membrane protein [Tannerella sp.]